MEQAQLRGAPLADVLCLGGGSCNISDVRGTFERPAIKQNQEVLVRSEKALAKENVLYGIEHVRVAQGGILESLILEAIPLWIRHKEHRRLASFIVRVSDSLLDVLLYLQIDLVGSTLVARFSRAQHRPQQVKAGSNKGRFALSHHVFSAHFKASREVSGRTGTEHCA